MTGDRRALLLVALALAGAGCRSHVARPVAELRVTSDSLQIEAGSWRQVHGLSFDAAGLPSADDVAWSSDRPSVATVSTLGEVTGVRPGTATITASSGGKRAAIHIAVTAARPDTIITVRPELPLQTMVGWEVTTYAGHFQCGDSAWPRLKDSIIDRAVNEAGVNRVRLELRSGSENPTDYFEGYRTGREAYKDWKANRYRVVNDNDDPNVADPAGFTFVDIDNSVREVVEPLRARLRARGESLLVNLNLVAFNEPGFSYRRHPEEAAELFAVNFRHLQTTYGWVPDGVEVLLEPDVAGWTADEVGHLVVAVGERLAREGYHPFITAPSNTSVVNAVNYFRRIIVMRGVRQYLTDVSYHRYGFSDESSVASIGALAALGGFRTMMLERIGADYERLHSDLTVGMNSAWSQFVLAGCGPDDGGMLYRFDRKAAAPVLTAGNRTPFLIQYFRWVRVGAVRLTATSNHRAFDPVAFRNRNGSMVVVVKALAAGTFTIEGLSPGTYGVTTTIARAPLVDGPDQVVGTDGRLRVSIGGTGVLTVHARTAATSR